MASNVRENVVKHLEDIRKTSPGSFTNTAKDRFGANFVTNYLCSPENEEFFGFLFEATQGTKSRIGIASYAIMAWEQNRRALVPEVERALWQAQATDKLFEAKLESMRGAMLEELKAGLEAPSLPKSVDSGLEELRLDMSREFLRISESLKELSAKVAEPPQPPVIPELPLAQLNEQVSVINQQLVAEAERRDALAKARASREAADKALRQERLALEEKVRAEKKAEKLARQKLRKEERKAKKARSREISKAKKAGVNPYTEEETRAYIAKLEKKGKTYYTPEQRAAHKATLGEERKTIVQKSREKSRTLARDSSKPKFVNYTPEQKAQFIKENFTDKGKRYYTKEERRRHHLGMKKSKPGVPVEGPTETST